MSKRIAYLGNFGPAHSTENHVKQAFEHIGVEVTPIQEDNVEQWNELLHERFDFILWTRTWSCPWAWEWMRRLAKRGVPVIGFHLDRWHGLGREFQLSEEPFFQCSDLVITADGGHPQMWIDHDINHMWMPPAVSEFECVGGEFDEQYASDLAFVGSWQPGYHSEWPHRAQLVEFLQKEYPEQCRFWPKAGEHAVRGEALRNLYASTKLNVGDSCLVDNAGFYWSDRIPETLGRGGLLIHPGTEGLALEFPMVETWELGDWDDLRATIEQILSRSDLALSRLRKRGRKHVLENHTYTVRAGQILKVVENL